MNPTPPPPTRVRLRPIAGCRRNPNAPKRDFQHLDGFRFPTRVCAHGMLWLLGFRMGRVMAF